MKARLIYALAVSAVMAALPVVGADTADGWVAKARAFLGSESALNAVKSIHFTGTLEAENGLTIPTDIIFQKPYQQRITVTTPKVIETTALDGYDAWQKRINPENPSQWQVTLLDGVQVKRLRANTLENLSFYSNQDKGARQVQFLGEATVDGVACVKLSFVHTNNISFMRYFEKATGRLIKTETESGGEIREEGVIIVSGIRFPRKVMNKGTNGKVTTITFDKVTVNGSIPPDAFAVPSLQAK